MNIEIKQVKAKLSKFLGGKTVIKEVVFLTGRGKNCKCYDCPVLYGGECPYDTAI